MQSGVGYRGGSRCRSPAFREGSRGRSKKTQEWVQGVDSAGGQEMEPGTDQGVSICDHGLYSRYESVCGFVGVDLFSGSEKN